GVTAGWRVLIHGSAGGVGTFAVQLARIFGARVTGTASAANLDFVRSLGADEAIDYRAERFEDVVRDVDVVFDTVGGETLERSWGVLKHGGRLVTVAASGEQTTDERIRIAYFIVEPSRAQLAEIARLIDGAALDPVVGAVFPLAEARQAYQHKPVRGKVVLRVVDGGGVSYAGRPANHGQAQPAVAADGAGMKRSAAMHNLEHLFLVGEFPARAHLLSGLTLEQVTLCPDGASHSIYAELWHVVACQQSVIEPGGPAGDVYPSAA